MNLFLVSSRLEEKRFGGGSSAPFLHREMLTESEVKALVETWLAGYTTDADFFVERVEVAGDAVRVYIDRDAGVGLEECAAVSRGLSAMLESEGVDAELEVSSPGLSEPIEHPRIFRKRLGSGVELLLTNRQKVRGVLQGYDGQQVEVLVMVKERPEGKKRSRLVERLETYPLEEIRSVRVSFDK